MTILPYNESICLRGGSFITPYGSIIPTYGKHEIAARNYCEGEIIERPQSGLEFLTPQPLLYRESQLTHKQAQDLLLWKRVYSNDYDKFWSDFAVFCLHFDKAGIHTEKIKVDDENFQFVETPTITTTCHSPHIRFYNYYMMDWRIDVLPGEIYNPKTDQFEPDHVLPYLDNYADLEAAEEIEKTKQYVKKKEDLPLFFK